MALLHILAGLRVELRCQPVAVYVNHGLRPDEADGEIACLEQVTERLDLPFHSFVVQTRARMKKYKCSLEAAARELRYRMLRKAAVQAGAETIAVAHTADDQVEEFLLRILRGSGRKGLAGMKFKYGDIVRPLLELSKKQILSWLGEQQIKFCHDSSNDDLKFLRNRVRHRLLPFLEKEFDTGVRQAILKTAGNLSVDEDYLEKQTQTAWNRVIAMVGDDGNNFGCNNLSSRLNREEFAPFHPCLQRRIVERLLWQMGCPARHVHIMAVMDAAHSGRTGSELHLNRGLRVAVSRDELCFSYPQGRGNRRGRLQ
jgi:tRNA(Ile)-lysidine synthase